MKFATVLTSGAVEHSKCSRIGSVRPHGLCTSMSFPFAVVFFMEPRLLANCLSDYEWMVHWSDTTEECVHGFWKSLVTDICEISISSIL